MENGVFFSIISLIYIISICISFFSKEKIITEENKLYKKILIINLISLLYEIFIATATVRGFIKVSESLQIILLKLIPVFILLWESFFSYYVCVISIKKEKTLTIFKYFLIIFFVISLLLIMLSPLYIYNKSNLAYTYGLSIDFAYYLSTILIVMCSILLMINFKSIFRKKY